MPKEIIVKPEAGQEVVVNPVGGLKIAKINRSASKLQARVTVEGVYVDPVEPPPVEPPPVEPPPVEPPPVEPLPGTIVQVGQLSSAIANARNGDTLILRGGEHVTSLIHTNKSLRLIAYAGEVPVITQTGRQDGLYFAGGPVLVKGINFLAGSGIFHDSMGSALSEVDGGHDVTYEDCVFTGDPVLDDHQQLLYQRLGTNTICRRCTFIGNGTKGFGFHQYPGTTSDPHTVLEQCTFRDIGYALTTDSRITVRDCTFVNVSQVAIQLRNSAGGSVITGNRGSNVGLGIQKPSGMSITDTGNVWA